MFDTESQYDSSNNSGIASKQRSDADTAPPLTVALGFAADLWGFPSELNLLDSGFNSLRTATWKALRTTSN